MKRQRTNLDQWARRHFRRTVAVALFFAFALTGCGRAADHSGAASAVNGIGSATTSTIRKSLSPKAARILTMVIEGKTEAAKRLLNDFEDVSEGEAETEVLKAALGVVDAFSAKTQSQELVLHMVPAALRGGSGSTSQIREHLQVAIDLNPRWKSLGGELIMDLVTAQLHSKAVRSESVHCLGDACLLSPKDDFYSKGGQVGAKHLDGVILGNLSLNSGATQLDMNSVLAANLLRKQRARHSDFLLGGSWRELIQLAEEFSPGALTRHQGPLTEVKREFARQGLHTSALLVERVASRVRQGSRLQDYQQGLGWLKECAASVRNPAALQNLAIALGYWAEAHPAEARETRSLAQTADLLKSISTLGGWCDAIVLAHHIGIPDLELPRPQPTYPWREPKENHQAFLAASAEKDVVRLEKLLRPLAELGHAEAMFELASLLELRARKSDASGEQVLDWYRKASQAGLAEAAKRLGQLYENGNVVDPDVQLALDYYRMAGNAGLPDALAYAAGVYLKTWRTSEATNFFVALHARAAAAGSTAAMNQLATHYLSLQNAKLDEKAVSLLQEASRHEYGPAQHNLGYCYLHGRGTAKDPVQGLRFTLMAATNGCPGSMFQAALLYQDGVGTKVDTEMREFWLARAYEAGDPDAARTYREREEQRRQRSLVMQRQAAFQQQQQHQQMAYEQARLQQQLASQQWMNQSTADVQDRTARAMRRYNQAVVPGLAAQGVNYWRPSR